MAAVRHLVFLKAFRPSEGYALRRAKMRHRAKFCANRSRRCGNMAVFNFSRWRSSAIFDFQKLEILTAHTLRRAKMRHRAKFRVDPIFQDGDRPPSWISYTPVWTTHEEYLAIFVTVQNLVGISIVVSIICKF